MIKFYYGPEVSPTEQYRIIPPPQISISQNNIYANDVIIGYTYTINLNGYASNYIANYEEAIYSSSGEPINPINPTNPITYGDYGIITSENGSGIDLSNEFNVLIITEDTMIASAISGIGSLGGAGTGSTTNTINSAGSSIRQVLYSINLINKILSNNGSTLSIKDVNNNNYIVAKGGFLKSLSFQESPNSWTKYSEYTAEIEFNELILFDELINCSTSYISGDSITTNLIDIEQYKLASFDDGWSFSLEDDSLNFVKKSDATNEFLNLQNTIINVTYNINATGKDYFAVEDKLTPAWVQAKNFAQKRLYNQVNNLSNILGISGPTACDTTKKLKDINSTAETGLISNIKLNYNLYDETINCSASESDGTFSLTYNAKLKVKAPGSFCSDDTTHTITKDVSTDKINNKTSISINGTIQGLCPGGLVSSSGNFILPANGSLLIGPSYNNRFDRAYNFLPNIIDIANDDLIESFKTALNINYTTLGVSGCGIIKPASFNLTKNYMEGTITYSAEYTTDRTCSYDVGSQTVSSTTISVEVPTAVLAEFPIPGGNFLLQDINTFTSRKISFTIEGKSPLYDNQCCYFNSSNLNLLLYSMMDNPNTIDSLLPSGTPIPNPLEFTRTKKDLNYNPVDGSYTINLDYTCISGCNSIS